MTRREPIKAKPVTKSWPHCFCFKANGFRMMDELRIQWAFFNIKEFLSGSSGIHK